MIQSSLQVGDGSGLVIALGGELLQQAETLLHMGLHPSDIVDGFVQAAAKADAILDGVREAGEGSGYYTLVYTAAAPVSDSRLDGQSTSCMVEGLETETRNLRLDARWRWVPSTASRTDFRCGRGTAA